MTTEQFKIISEQFKIICRAFFPDCEFYLECGVWYCYIDDECRVAFDVGLAKVNGILGEYPDEKVITGKPEYVIKAVYNDMRSRDDNRTV